jgi:hypothetical protein
VVVVYGGLGRGRGGSGIRLGVMARERDRRPRPVFQADPIEGIGGRGFTNARNYKTRILLRSAAKTAA